MRTAATGALRGTHRQKHIFVGQTRIASKLHYSDQSPSTRALYMQQNTFWYHTRCVPQPEPCMARNAPTPDHLGSTNWVTDHQGEGYEHFTYTPYGEVWVEEHLSSKIHRTNHRFTGQELDPETGLYAFPARNYDPRTSRWLSADPALEEYLPEPGQKPGDLVGMGGVFTPVNLQIYHYGANNPLKYVDPDGRTIRIRGVDLTLKEFLLVIIHPFAARKIEANRPIASEASRKFSNQFLEGEGNHNGPADAFRHALFSAMNARDVGERKAKRFGDAHEAKKDQPDVERRMDLYNNEVGRRIGAENPDATDQELSDLVLDAMINGELILSADSNKQSNSSYRYLNFKGVNSFE